MPFTQHDLSTTCFQDSQENVLISSLITSQLRKLGRFLKQSLKPPKFKVLSPQSPDLAPEMSAWVIFLLARAAARVELHVHLDGSIEPAELFAIAKACAIDGVVVSGGSLPARLFKSRLTTGRYMEVFFSTSRSCSFKVRSGALCSKSTAVYVATICERASQRNRQVLGFGQL